MMYRTPKSFVMQMTARLGGIFDVISVSTPDSQTKYAKLYMGNMFSEAVINAPRQACVGSATLHSKLHKM
mgnify:FL=1